MGNCRTCLSSISSGSRTGICRSCYLAKKADPRKHCSACAKPIYPNAKGKCRACYLAERMIPPPADFAERAREMSGVDLQRHYGRSDSLVRRWIKETGISPANVRLTTRKPIPADFITVAPTMSLNALRAHYRCDYRALKRWMAESGVKPRPYDNSAPKDGHRRKGCYQRLSLAERRRYAGPNPAFASRLPHDTSLEGQAADHLRCETRAIIYRCNERGAVPDLPMRRAGREHLADRSSLKFWRIGNAVVTPEELIARARRRGWVSLGELLSGHHGAKGFVTCLALARAEP